VSLVHPNRTYRMSLVDPGVVEVLPDLFDELMAAFRDQAAYQAYDDVKPARKHSCNVPRTMSTRECTVQALQDLNLRLGVVTNSDSRIRTQGKPVSTDTNRKRRRCLARRWDSSLFRPNCREPRGGRREGHREPRNLGPRNAACRGRWGVNSSRRGPRTKVRTKSTRDCQC
jgi:hypothetical protein